MEKSLRDTLREQMQSKGLSVQKLRQQTGIAERYLVALMEGESEKLPATPYVRGYLFKIGSILDLNGTELWELYKKEGIVKSSGNTDKLPSNRFALKQISKPWLGGGVLLGAFLIYLILNLSRFLGAPGIVITNPPDTTTMEVATDAILLTGKTDPAYKLSIGGEEAALNPDGSFLFSYKLEPGLNQIEFSVQKFLGKTRTEIRRVIYTPPEENPKP